MCRFSYIVSSLLSFGKLRYLVFLSQQGMSLLGGCRRVSLDAFFLRTKRLHDKRRPFPGIKPTFACSSSCYAKMPSRAMYACMFKLTTCQSVISCWWFHKRRMCTAQVNISLFLCPPPFLSRSNHVPAATHVGDGRLRASLVHGECGFQC